MKPMTIFYFVLLVKAFAAEKHISGSVHGPKMMVEHVRLESGQEALRVRQIAVNGAKQTVELNLAKHELLANEFGFRCENQHGEQVYAVISKKRAKEQELFPAERAWTINEDKPSLDPVAAIGKVKCFFSPVGDGVYPFK